MKVTKLHYVSYYSLIFHSDINECVQGLAGCNHNCTNTAGSHFCTCTDGYELESDNHTCKGDDYNQLVTKFLVC